VSFRSVVGLHYAAMCLRPAHIPKSRPKGSKAAGLRYEKALAAAIPRAEHGQWFEFKDLNGPGHCQMDLVIEGAKRVVIIECKLTEVEQGQEQLEKLYFPIAKLVWPDKKPLGIVAVRHLSKCPDVREVETTLKGAILRAETKGVIPVMHWMERMPL
jgi:hypothetical protein